VFRERLLLPFALLLAVGCSNSGKQPLAPLTGTVTYQGKPVVGASMTFIPDNKAFRPAIALTDKEGRYRMETYEPGDGAGVGKGVISISLRGPAKSIPAGVGDAVLEQLSDVGDPLIPIKYFKPETSGLEFEVKPNTRNVFDITLTD
jgi:hypothetical protein